MTNLSYALIVAGTVIQALEDHGLLERRTWSILEKPSSPWILIDAVPNALGKSNGLLPYHFAIWRVSGKLHLVDETGAVEENPIPLRDAVFRAEENHEEN